MAAIAAVVVFLAGGALAAMAATGHKHILGAPHARPAARRGGRGQLAKAATYLGLSVSQLRGDLRSGKTLAEIADTTPGKSEAGLIAELVAARRAKLTADAASLQAMVTAEVNRPLGPHLHTRGVLVVARGYLGISAAQLRSDRHAGKTFAQIADATPGKSESGLIEALVSARKHSLATALATGALSRASEETRLAKLDERVSALVERVPSKHSSR